MRAGLADAQQIVDGAGKSALSSLLSGATDTALEERAARERARMYLADVVAAAKGPEWIHYDPADGI